MTAPLPNNLDALRRQRTTEGERLPIHKRAERDAPQVTGQVTGQDTGQVAGPPDEPLSRVVLAMARDMSRYELQTSLGLAHRDHFVELYLQPSLRPASSR